MELSKFIEGYYGIKYDEFLKHAEDYAQSCMEQELVCRAIAQKENMTVSDEDYEKILEEYYEPNSNLFKDKAALEEYYGKDRLKNDVLLRKAMDLVEEKAVIIPPSETEGATEGETEEATKSGN